MTASPSFSSNTIFTAPPPELALTEAEDRFFRRAGDRAFPFKASGHFLSLVKPGDPDDPIRRQILPTEAELTVREYESDDPLAEAQAEASPGLVRRYADRCIFKVTQACAVHCRFCFRKGVLSGSAGAIGREETLAAARFLAGHPEIREVLLTGGDPLMLSDGALESIMATMRSARPGILLRIGTRVPIALPGRVTAELAGLLRRFQPLWLTVHCNHPAELAPEAAAALGLLQAHGLKLGGQSVLLAGVNDSPETLGELFRRQAETGLRPYYLFHLDPAPGTAHFRVPLERGLRLVRETRVRFPGLLLPVYALDLPEGRGKRPVESLAISEADGERVWLRDGEGNSCRYPR